MPPLLSLQIERKDIGVRLHNQIMRAVLHSVAQHHLAFNMPLRFADVPATKPGGVLGFKGRTRKWQKRKMAMVGHNIPNLLTGALRASVLGSSRITATKDRARLYVKAHRPLRDQQRAEMESMSAGELRQAINLAKRLYVEEVKASKATTKTRI